MTHKKCSVCGSQYTDDYLQKNGGDNACCRDGSNLATYKGADPDETTQDSYLQKLKDEPPEAPEEFQGIEDRDGP